MVKLEKREEKNVFLLPPDAPPEEDPNEPGMEKSVPPEVGLEVELAEADI